jgi:hypothetical protein
MQMPKISDDLDKSPMDVASTLQTKKCGQTSKSDLQPPQLKGRSLNELAPAGMENWSR